MRNKLINQEDSVNKKSNVLIETFIISRRKLLRQFGCHHKYYLKKEKKLFIREGWLRNPSRRFNSLFSHKFRNVLDF